MDHVSFSQHIPQHSSGSSGQYSFHEQQSMHAQDLIQSRKGLELSSDLSGGGGGATIIVHPSNEMSKDGFSSNSDGTINVQSSDTMMINSRINRRFTIGTPIQTTELINPTTTTIESSTMNDPLNNLWRRTYQTSNVPIGGSTWEQSLTNDSIRPFTSPGCLGTVQSEDWSTKTFTNHENERMHNNNNNPASTTNDLTFFEQLTSTDITDDLREISPEFSYDALHGQGIGGSNGTTNYTIKASKKTITTTNKTVRKTKKEKDPNRLADRRKRRRESHNAVERRRRDLINDRIAELAMLLPKDDLIDAIAHSASGGTMPHINLEPFLSQRQDLLQDNFFVDNHQLDAIAQSKPNKGIILTKAVEYIRYLRHACAILRQDNERLQAADRFDNQHL
jgi:Helix-loop-helix DNA-binding domain